MHVHLPERLNVFFFIWAFVIEGSLSLYAGQKYCGMLQVEHSAILLTFIKLPFSFKTFVSIMLYVCKQQRLVW